MQSDATLTLTCPESYMPGSSELGLAVKTEVPAELTVSVHDAQGMLVRRICQSQLTRPSPEDVTYLYWDGRDQNGSRVPAGRYTFTAEANLCGKRAKATADVTIF